MTVQFQNSPVSNTTTATLQLNLAAVPQLVLGPNGVAVSNVIFDQVLVFDPPNPVAGFDQQPVPPPVVAVPVGDVAYFSRAVGPARVLLRHGPPGGNQVTITFQ